MIEETTAELAVDDVLGCQGCGFINPASESLCLACAATLEIDHRERYTGRYNGVRRQIERLKSGDMDMDEFRGWLDDLLTEMLARGRGIIAFMQETQYWQENTEEVEMGLAGVEAFEAGLYEIASYAEDFNNKHLDEGLQLCWQGTEKIIDAMRINRKNRESLAMEWDTLQDELTA